MGQRIEAFQADVALEGETTDATREAVRAGLADCEAVFRSQEANRRMKKKAEHACHSLPRPRSRRDTAADGDTDRGPFKIGPQHYRVGPPKADHS